MLGDFAKGPIDERFAPALHFGISLHRKIDTFTDAHHLTLASRNRFAGELRRYAGIIVDMVYDHFLATKWSNYCQLPLPDFTQKVYAVLLHQRSSFEGRALQVLERMVEHDWLGSYLSLGNIETALASISRRMSRTNSLDRCGDALARAYTGLEADFVAFFPELVTHAAAIRCARSRASADTLLV